jgi:ADP-ribosylglycohydrolase
MLGAIVGDVVGSVYEFYGLTAEEIRIVEKN